MKHEVYEITNISLDRYHLKLNEALFHNANGYIGVRYDFEEGYSEDFDMCPSQYINGFYDFSEIKRVENHYGLVNETQIIVNIGNTQTIRLIIDGEMFNMFQGVVIESKLSLNICKGITVREVLWRSEKGKEIRLTIKRMASFHILPLFTIEYEIEPLNFSGEVIIESVHDGNAINYGDPNDPRIASERKKFITPVNCEIKEGRSYITSKTSKSDLVLCSCVENKLSQNCKKEFLVNDNKTTCIIKTDAQIGQKISLIKYSVFSDSVRHEDVKIKACAFMEDALSVTLEELYIKQQEYLKDYWENSFVEIYGDDELDMAIKFNLYQLIQSVSKDSYGNISPKGLSGDGYDGNYFWDTEIYIQPFFTITNPKFTKELIGYRFRTLNLARENAKVLGHNKGALYPWRTIMGKEASGYFPAGSAQYHINADIAYSIIAYYLATKDVSLLLEMGAEIIFETARLWLETGNYSEGRYNINTVTGPDEYTCIVNNNYYTNIMAQYHMRWAEKIYYQLEENEEFRKLIKKIGLTENEIKAFRMAADAMYLPFDEKHKMNPQDDSFFQKKLWDINSIPKESFPLLLNYHPLHIYRHQICKQADTILAYFLIEDAQTEECMKNSYLYYEKITTHDSSLSKSIFSIMAARLGMYQKAYDYFGDSAKLDLLDLHKNTDDGIHVANIAGSYLTIVYGFAGFRLKEKGIYFSPILPEKWDGYRFEITYEKSRIVIKINKDYCNFLLENGEPRKIHVYGKEYMLEDSLSIEREHTIEV